MLKGVYTNYSRFTLFCVAIITGKNNAFVITSTSVTFLKAVVDEFIINILQSVIDLEINNWAASETPTPCTAVVLFNGLLIQLANKK